MEENNIEWWLLMPLMVEREGHVGVRHYPRWGMRNYYPHYKKINMLPSLFSPLIPITPSFFPFSSYIVFYYLAITLNPSKPLSTSSLTFRILGMQIILYAELYACCVEYIILESDNLSSLFPNAHLNVFGLALDSHRLFALATTIAILPTCWLRDLSVLSYISAGGVIASVLVVLCLFWVGLVDKVDFAGKGSVLNLSTLPVAIGLYGFLYSGHAVFPNIYSSMANPRQYSAVLLTSFGICTLMCGGAAVLGYMMFGESTQSQFTLNLPPDLFATKLALWTTVVNPFTKYALTMSPVAMCLEELIPSRHLKSHLYPILIRTALVISTLLVGLSIPFFGLVMALIGSLLTMLVTFILPCACYLSILRGKLTYLQMSACAVVIAVGTISSGFGTYSALTKIINNLT